MNIDERLEALTMNLELAHRDIQDLRASLQELTANVGELTGTVAELTGTVGKLTGTVGNLATIMQAEFAETGRTFETVHDSIRMLANIVVAHQQKLDELENNTDQP